MAAAKTKRAASSTATKTPKGKKRVWVKAHTRKRPESWLSKKARQDAEMPF